MAIKWLLTPGDTSWENYWGEKSIQMELDMTINDYPKIIRAVEKYAARNKVVFEGGCGLGRWLFYLNGKGCNHLVGLDTVTPPLYAIKQQDDGIGIIQGNVNSLPLRDATVQLYLSMGVMEHFEEGPQEVLQEANRVLGEGGVLIVSVPYQNFYRSTFRRFVTMPLLKLFKPAFRNKRRIFYQYYYNKRDLRTFLHQANFKIREWFYYDKFHTPNIRLGIYLEFPFLRQKNGKAFELNKFGKYLAKYSEYLSPGLFSSNIVFIAMKASQ